jgi:hypothetical protein
MKNQQNRLFPFVFVLTYLLNSAFVIHSKSNSTINTTVSSVHGTPQYKAPKMTFFEQFVAKKLIKRLKTESTIDLDETAKSAKKVGGYSIPLIPVGLILAFLPSFAGIIASLIVLALAGLLGLIAIYKAFLVINNPNATEAQKEIAHKGRRSGAWGLSLAIVLFILVALYFDYRRNS